MADPTGSSAKIATEMMKEVQDAAKQAEVKKPDLHKPEVDFHNVLATQKTHEVNAARNDQTVTEVLRTATQTQRGVPPVAPVGESINAGPLKSGLHQLMNQVMDGQNKLEDIMKVCLSGKNFSSSELLALQAGVFRFTQELELTSKVIEKGTSSIKQVLNTQV
jgi:hypothetical protein